MRRHPGLFLTIIILVAVAAALFVYPKNWGAKMLPWRLGLDLVGGTHLVYQIDLSKVAATDQRFGRAGPPRRHRKTRQSFRRERAAGLYRAERGTAPSSTSISPA